MVMIEIQALENGAHRNQTFHGTLPDGWAVIHENLECENFPFGNPTVETIDGLPTVIAWASLPIPEPEPEPDPEPTAEELLNALLGVTANE